METLCVLYRKVQPMRWLMHGIINVGIVHA